MGYPINTDAVAAGKALVGIKMNIDSIKDVVSLDDNPLNLDPVVTHIKQIITDTITELSSTQNIED